MAGPDLKGCPQWAEGFAFSKKAPFRWPPQSRERRLGICLSAQHSDKTGLPELSPKTLAEKISTQ